MPMLMPASYKERLRFLLHRARIRLASRSIPGSFDTCSDADVARHLSRFIPSFHPLVNEDVLVRFCIYYSEHGIQHIFADEDILRKFFTSCFDTMYCNRRRLLSQGSRIEGNLGPMRHIYACFTRILDSGLPCIHDATREMVEGHFFPMIQCMIEYAVHYLVLPQRIKGAMTWIAQILWKIASVYHEQVAKITDFSMAKTNPKGYNEIVLGLRYCAERYAISPHPSSVALMFYETIGLFCWQLQDRLGCETWLDDLPRAMGVTSTWALRNPFLYTFGEKIRVLKNLVGNHVDFTAEPIHVWRDWAQRYIERSEDSILSALRQSGPLLVRYRTESTDEGLEPGHGVGLGKDFITLMIAGGLDPEFELFKVAGDGSLYPNPDSIFDDKCYRLFGALVGKAVSMRMTVGVPLSKFFLRTLQGKKNYMADIESLDSDILLAMMNLKDIVDDDIDISNCCLSFCPPGEDIELISGGQDVVIDKYNFHTYLDLCSRYKLLTQIESKCFSFKEGFNLIIDPEWISMFDTSELQLLISGQEEINLHDLEKGMIYGSPFSRDHSTIQIFWKVLGQFSQSELSKFLRFVTGSSRAPPLGFEKTEPKIGVYMETRDGWLPTAATCFSRIKLPPYTDEESMRRCLLMAMETVIFELA